MAKPVRSDLERRAAASLSATPRPFLKWAGSKRQLLPDLVKVLPEQYGRYWEPFLGSAALFFLLRPATATLSDSCLPLIETFEAVRDDSLSVLRAAAQWDTDEATFYEIRSAKVRGRFQRAGRFLYLNKTCWNGLYRVNSRGEFNVPYGSPKSPVDFGDPGNLNACARSLAKRGVRLECADFEDALQDVSEGDLVYLDPPYVTQHNNNGFVDYNEKLFTWDDQRRLASLARSMKKVGAHVIATNAHHSDVIALYKGFDIHRITRHSTLAADVTKRTRVDEVLMTG